MITVNLAMVLAYLAGFHGGEGDTSNDGQEKDVDSHGLPKEPSWLYRGVAVGVAAAASEAR